MYINQINRNLIFCLCYQNLNEDDGTYTLIDNTVNAIYPLYWNGKTNYFASYNDAEPYLLELIKLEAVKVLI